MRYLEELIEMFPPATDGERRRRRRRRSYSVTWRKSSEGKRGKEHLRERKRDRRKKKGDRRKEKR